MNIMIIALSIALIVFSVILVAVILFQSNRSANMSGAVAGAGASNNNFYGKNKGMTREMLMKRLTVVFSILFVLIVLVLNILELM